MILYGTDNCPHHGAPAAFSLMRYCHSGFGKYNRTLNNRRLIYFFGLEENRQLWYDFHPLTRIQEQYYGRSEFRYYDRILWVSAD